MQKKNPKIYLSHFVRYNEKEISLLRIQYTGIGDYKHVINSVKLVSTEPFENVTHVNNKELYLHHDNLFIAYFEAVKKYNQCIADEFKN